MDIDNIYVMVTWYFRVFPLVLGWWHRRLAERVLLLRRQSPLLDLLEVATQRIAAACTSRVHNGRRFASDGRLFFFSFRARVSGINMNMLCLVTRSKAKIYL